MKVTALARRGTTLVELMVTLVIMTLIASAAGLAIRSTRTPAVASTATRLIEARHEAMARGVPITIEILVDGVVRRATAFPDGMLIADSSFMRDLLTGGDLRVRP